MNQPQSVKAIIDEISHYYESIIGCMPGNVYWLDQECRGVGCNHNVLKMFQFKTIDQFRGITFQEMARVANWSQEAAHSFHADTDEVIRTGKAKLNVQEPPIPDSHGNPIYFLTSRVPLFDQNHTVLGVVGISVDITEKIIAQENEKIALANAVAERIKAEKEREMRQSVMIFSGAIAHDQKTSLATLNLMSHVLKNHLEDIIAGYQLAQENHLSIKPVPHQILSTLKTFGEKIHTVTMRMNTSVDEALKSLRHSAQQDPTKADLEICSLSQCLGEIIDEFPYKDHEAELIRWDRSGDFLFLGTYILFSNMINNLLKNAFEQIHKNSRGEIFISARSIEKMNYLHIKDTASGALKEEIENFFQGYRTDKKEGTGIGLASCKLTMKSFGGDITVQSVLGDYIEFILSFPKIE